MLKSLYVVKSYLFLFVNDDVSFIFSRPVITCGKQVNCFTQVYFLFVFLAFYKFLFCRPCPLFNFFYVLQLSINYHGKSLCEHCVFPLFCL